MEFLQQIQEHKQTILYGLMGTFVLVLSVITAFVFSAVGRFLVFWRDISKAAVFRLRVTGGGFGAAFAMFLMTFLGMGGGGDGWFGGGPGQGSGKGSNHSNDTVTHISTPTTTPEENPPEKPRPEEKPTAVALAPRSLQIKLLGADTIPPAASKKKIFLIVEQDSTPSGQPMDAQSIEDRLKELRPKQPISEVVIQVDPDRSTRRDHSEMEELRKKIKGLGLGFVMRDLEGKP